MRRWLHVLATCGLISVSLSVIWVHRFLPLQDYPDWLLQGHIFATWIRGQEYPGYEIHPVPAPNIISTLAIGLGNLVFSPEVSGKVLLTVYVVCFIFLGSYFYRSFTKAETAFQYLPFALAFGFPFFHGNISSVFSVPILLAVIGYVRNRYDNPQGVNALALGALLLLLYFSHLVSFGVAVLFLAVYVALQRKAARPMLMRKLAMSLFPLLMGLAAYLYSSSGNVTIYWGATLESPATWATFKAWSAIKYYSLFHHFYPFYEDSHAVLVVLNFLWQGVILGLFLMFLIRLRSLYDRDRTLLVTFAACALVFLLAPQAIEPGIISDPGQRLLYPLLLMMTGLLAQDFPLARTQHKMGYVAAVLAFIAILNWSTWPIALKMENTYSEYAALNLHKVDFCSIDARDFDLGPEREYPLQGLRQLLPGHSPLARLHYYLGLYSNRYLPVFSTGLIRSQDSHVRLPDVRGGPGNCEAVVVTGYRGDNERVAALLGGGYERGFCGEYFIYLRRLK